MRRPRARLATQICAALLVCALLAAGCEREPAIPTQTDLSMVETAAFLTQNAPPPNFQDNVQAAPIDKNLDSQTNWHYQAVLSFDGMFADTRKAIKGTIEVEVWNDQIGERRVVVQASGDALGLAGARRVEGVRISNTYYFVDQNNVCSIATDNPDRKRVAELTAGNLIGGVRRATAMNTPLREADGLKVWEYRFLPSDVDSPEIEMTQGGQVSIASGQLWIAPSLNAVYEYALTLNVDSIIMPIFQGSRQLTGKVQISYRLVQHGTPNNISIPFGC